MIESNVKSAILNCSRKIYVYACLMIKDKKREPAISELNYFPLQSNPVLEIWLHVIGRVGSIQSDVPFWQIKTQIPEHVML